MKALVTLARLVQPLGDCRPLLAELEQALDDCKQAFGPSFASHDMAGLIALSICTARRLEIPRASADVFTGPALSEDAGKPRSEPRPRLPSPLDTLDFIARADAMHALGRRAIAWLLAVPISQSTRSPDHLCAACIQAAQVCDAHAEEFRAMHEMAARLLGSAEAAT